MEVLSAENIRKWDQYTIENEPIASIDLMERAATACFQWISTQWDKQFSFTIFCGKGNNGGDGLAIGRMLYHAGYKVSINILEFGHPGTADFQTNLSALHELNVPLRYISSTDLFPETVEQNTVIIDALLGTGLNRKVEGLTESLIRFINKYTCPVVSVDIPSGLSADETSIGNVVVQATHTLTLQCYKMAFLFPENEKHTGTIHLLNIGLLPSFLETINLNPSITTEKLISTFILPSKKFSHKGNKGHALIIAGSYGKTGAAVLAAKACLHSGVGLLSVHIPSSSYTILQQCVPEAMVYTDKNAFLISEVAYNIEKFNAIGIGPGIGKNPETAAVLQTLFSYKKPLAIDADALNIIAENKELLNEIPTDSVLTPHPKEFERLFGVAENNFNRMELALKMAERYQIHIVLKGRFTLIATKDGRAFFNPTGNAGMATGGTGDALTGIITALFANGLKTADAAIAGVYLHGLAGDYAAVRYSEPYLSASLLIENLSEAFLHILTKKAN